MRTGTSGYMPQDDALDILRAELGDGGWNSPPLLIQCLVRVAGQFPSYQAVLAQMALGVGVDGIPQVDLSAISLDAEDMRHALGVLYAAPPIQNLILHPDTPLHVASYLRRAAMVQSVASETPVPDAYSYMGPLVPLTQDPVVETGPCIVSVRRILGRGPLEGLNVLTSCSLGKGRCLVVAQRLGTGRSRYRADPSLPCEWYILTKGVTFVEWEEETEDESDYDTGSECQSEGDTPHEGQLQATVDAPVQALQVGTVTASHGGVEAEPAPDSSPADNEVHGVYEPSISSERVNTLPGLTNVNSCYMWMSGGALHVLVHRTTREAHDYNKYRAVPCDPAQLLYRVDPLSLECVPVPDVSLPPYLGVRQLEYAAF
ncbi:hypothetical protein KIPB_014314, partial [Kipferlia bialata]|eukprot:g14314.t1